MKNLRYILDRLKEKKYSHKGKYFIPKAWNCIEYCEYTVEEGRKGEINVNPYDFLSSCIENHILSNINTDTNTNFLTPLGLRNGGLSADPNKSTIYSMFPRMLTAWQHTEERKLFPGTFLKAICLLPHIQSLGINTIYLLPVFEYSSRYKKGEIGSPYAIKNIYKLDKNLHDPLLGENAELILETEFKAFIEACHILGIQVMVDFVFRTVSRDNDLIVEHPDWFYWIDLKHSNTFAAPVVNKIKRSIVLDEKSFFYLYKSRELKRYLAQFTYSPKEIDFDRWMKIVQKHRQTGENILDLVETEFKITTVPGFSNVINDQQPPWTDVTYLKFYYDVHEKARKFINEDQPPYIMQDGVCLNLCRGELENKELREYISGVIPYYQEKFGIDGARIDMGHALSSDLNKEIIARAKANNKNFILWSEEFDPDKSGEAKKYGYHFISGYTWSIYKGLENPGFNKNLITDTLMKAEIPITAALETPDTPRAALVHTDKKKIKLLAFLNCFIPNSVPFINNGIEVMELQPMNLGLDNSEEGRFVLEKNDPMYGKLAFFDNYCLHWTNDNRKWMHNLLSQAFKIRENFIDILSKKENYIEQPEHLKNKKIIFLCYFDNEICKGVFFLANRNLNSRARINFGQLFPEKVRKNITGITFVYGNTQLSMEQRKFLDPGEVVIGSIM